jgi:uncharacterized protein
LVVNSVREWGIIKIGQEYIATKRIINIILFTIFIAGCKQSYELQIAKTERTDKPTSQIISDSDSDGIPDAAELRTYDDRSSFRRWFTALAEMQFYRLSDAWSEKQRDCAGLVRFAWRESLRRHDRLWFQMMGEGYEAVAPDLHAYTLDRSPLGEKLFRIDYGSYLENDPNFSEFADARTLKNHNTVFVSRDPGRALPGDLLFFHQPWVHKFPYHVMIYLGEARHASEGATDWVVYHTGSSGGGEGEVRKVRLSSLNQHPDKRWRPVENNRNFLGIYRLKILEQE